ncbi:MAG: glycosyltransferase family 4 protein, partial [Desulfocucumaceae bacterium]
GTLLIDVLAKLRQEQFPVRLVFVGEITPDKQAWFRKLAEDRGVAEAVSFTGFCSPEDVSRYLASSDIGLFPFRDGVSLRRTSFLAAMQHGLAVVTTQAGNYVPTELVDGENVLLVPAGDRERFVQAARRLALDATLRHKLSVNARRWGASFAWEIIARRHLALYRQFSGLGTEEGTGK